MMKRQLLILFLASILATTLVYASNDQEKPGEETGSEEAEDARLNEMERRLAFMEQKMSMLGSNPEDFLMQPVGEFLQTPERILEQAVAEYRNRNWEEAYRWAILIHVLHPDHELAREGFEIATFSFDIPYNSERMQNESFRWRNHERPLMYAWMRYRVTSNDFDPDEFRAFFSGKHASFFWDFFGNRDKEQEIGDWRITIELDNGRVHNLRSEAITATE